MSSEQQVGGSSNTNASKSNHRRRPRRNYKKNKNKQQQQQQGDAALVREEVKKAEEEERLQKIKEEQERIEAEKEEKRRLEIQLRREKVRLAVRSVEEFCASVLEKADFRSKLVPLHLSSVDGSTEMNPWLAEARANHRNSKKSLKSDLKKCTAFVKKVKTLAGASGVPAKEAICKALIKDIQTLNLSRYVDEIASAILESKFKMVDIPLLCIVVKAMYERYDDFLPALLTPMQEFLRGKSKGVDEKEVPKLRRLYLRFITELLVLGVIFESKLIIRVLAEASGAQKGQQVNDHSTYQVTDATLVVAFAKSAGMEVVGRIPRSLRLSIATMKEFSSSTDIMEEDEEGLHLKSNVDSSISKLEAVLGIRALIPEAQAIIECHCIGTFNSLSNSLVQTHDRLRKLQKRCEQDKLLTGSLTESREKGLSDAEKLYENLQKSVESLSDILDKDQPILNEEEEELGAGSSGGLELWTKGETEELSDWGPFDDEETWALYCDVPDFLTTVPIALLGISQEQQEAKKSSNLQKYGLDENIAKDEEILSDTPNVQPSESESMPTELEEINEEAEDEEDAEVDKDTPHYKLMVLLDEELPELHSREKTDELAEKFIVNHGSNKNSRKRLTKVLFHVPRTRLDLLPHYSRFLAIVDRVYDDVAAQVVRDLESQFHGYARYKKNINIESRMKNARYIGELTKFRVAPPIVSLRALQRCLEDFTGANIDVACCILESCGRFLHRTKFTNSRVTSLMDTMMRLRKAKNLDDRHMTLIDFAFYNVSPPQNASLARSRTKVLPPFEAYIKFLLMDKLCPDEVIVSFVLKQLLRLPWNDESIDYGALVCKYMLKAARRGRYKVSIAIAMLVEKARRTCTEITVRLVDAVFEGLQYSLEQPRFRDQQRTISLARLMGDLFNVGIVTSSSLFEELYHFINFGHDIPEALRDASIKHEEQKSSISFSAMSSSILGQTIAEEKEVNEEDLPPAQEVEISPVAVSKYSKFDPRVPCILDGPTSVLRIKLICTVLEKAKNALISSSNQGNTNVVRLQRFVTHFQRYLFTKTMLPTEVEFAVLDLFDSLDSSLKCRQKKGSSKADASKFSVPRYDNWSDAHAAAIAADEAEAKQQERGKQKLLEQGLDILDSESDSEDDDDDDDESVDRSSLASSARVGYVDDSEGSENSSDSDEDSLIDSNEESADSEGYDEDDALDEAEQEEANKRQLEAEAFEQELRKLTLEGLEKGKASARANSNAGKVSDSMIHASQFSGKRTENKSSPEDTLSTLGGQEGMTFQLVRRGHKGRVETKALVVPSDTHLAKQALKQDDEEARERDMIKAKVLQYEADSNEQGSGGNLYLDQAKLTVIRNRPLSLEEIERNFGKDGGSDGKWGTVDKEHTETRRLTRITPTGRGGSIGRGQGRGGRGRGRGGRTLRTW